MHPPRALLRYISTINPKCISSQCHNVAQLNHHPHHQQQQLLLRRSISTTGSRSSWMDSIKGVFTGKKKEEGENPMETAASFTLTRFADELKKAQKVGSFKQYIVGRSSEATFSDAFAKMEAVIRYLSTFDPAGENLQTSHKQAAAKHCNCTIAEVESALAKFTWAKQAQAKLDKMKEEGKPMPKSLAEVQKLMGNTPMDLARSNLAKSGQISRNAFCPCGSKKRYKKCCGKDKEAN
ncbi:Protein translocase subunit SecA [Linum perenne]